MGRILPRFRGGALDPVFEKAESGERLTFDDGLKLFRSRDLTALGALADLACRKRHGRKVFFSNYLNLNPTNICANQCRLCSFFRRPGAKDAYALSAGEIRGRVRKAVEVYGIREVHVVGGLNDFLPPDYYFDVISWVKETDPGLFVKAYTAVEIDYLARRRKNSPEDVLRELKKRGLDSIPGGGAEIFSKVVRKKICPDKIDADAWLGIHREAHRLGIPSNATMLYGHIESVEDRVDHLLRLRELQDEAIVRKKGRQNSGAGFNAFVPLAFQKANNALGETLSGGGTDGITDLKVIAVARLLLDNVPHIRAHWPAIGIRFAQAALSFGADDLGGTALDENVLRQAGSGASIAVSRKEMIRLIRRCRRQPCEVVSSY